jgi:hypothetical protein
MTCCSSILLVYFSTNSVVFWIKKNLLIMSLLFAFQFLLMISALKQPLGDAYGLLMHRNGQWEWTLAPGVSPSSRYQHAAVSDLYKSESFNF